MIESAVTLLPEPDSPTMATVSFGPMEKERFRTTGRHSPSTRKAVVRPETSRIGSVTRRARPLYRMRRGSSASRSPSPTKLIDSTVRKIAAPGKSAQ